MEASEHLGFGVSFLPQKKHGQNRGDIQGRGKKKTNHYVKGFLHTVYLKDGWQGCRLLQSRPPWQRVWNQSVGRNVLCVIAQYIMLKKDRWLLRTSRIFKGLEGRSGLAVAQPKGVGGMKGWSRSQLFFSLSLSLRELCQAAWRPGKGGQWWSMRWYLLREGAIPVAALRGHLASERKDKAYQT